MGFDGLFFGRLDYADKDKRIKQKSMEMIWKASESLGDSSSLFTGALFNGYGPPKGFCFDENCDDEPIMDDPRVGFFERMFAYLYKVEKKSNLPFLFSVFWEGN